MRVSRVQPTQASTRSAIGRETERERQLRGKTAYRGRAGAAGLIVDGLSRRVALFGERAADVLAGVDHVIRLGLAGGVAAIVTEASAFEELGELPRFVSLSVMISTVIMIGSWFAVDQALPASRAAVSRSALDAASTVLR